MDNVIPLSSTIESIVTNAKEMSFTTVDRLQSKLAKSLNALDDLMSKSSSDIIFQLSDRFTNIGTQIIQGSKFKISLSSMNYYACFINTFNFIKGFKQPVL